MTLGRDTASASRPPAPDRLPSSRVAATAAPTRDPNGAPRLAALLIPLTPAIDMAEGLPATHALRTAFVAVQLGQRLGFDRTALTDTYYAALLKDLGATAARSKALHTFGPGSRAVYRELHSADLSSLRGSLRVALPLLRSEGPWRQRLASFIDITFGSARGPVQIERLRGRTGASIALDMGFNRGTADAILAQNERWDGRGRPEAQAGEGVALSGRVLNVAQALVSAWFEGGVALASAQLGRLAGNQLDPSLVSHAALLLDDPRFVEALGAHDIEQVALEAEPTGRGYASASRVDRLLSGFARFIDAKSPWTYRHSERVRELAVGAGLQLDAPLQLGQAALRRLKRAALLHDLARLATPTEVLDSHRTLSDTEIELVRSGRPLLRGSLKGVLDLADLAPVTETYSGFEPATAMDATLTPLAPEQREEVIATLLSLAEKFEAMTAPRPHRERRTFDEALGVLRQETERSGGLSRAALSGLERFLATPTAAAVLAPRTFDPNAIVVVD